MFQIQGLIGCCDTLKSLQHLYRVELLHREIPVIVTGNAFAVIDTYMLSKIKGQSTTSPAAENFKTLGILCYVDLVTLVGEI